MLDILRKYVLNSWFAIVGIVISAISFIAGLSGIDFIISQTGYWLIAIVTLIAVLLNSIVALAQKNVALTNPDVSFEIEPTTDDISYPNIRFTTDRQYIKGETLSEVVEMKFYTNIRVNVNESSDISIKFDLIDVDTDLPTVKDKYRVEAHDGSYLPIKNVIEAKGNSWVDIHMTFYFDMPLYPIDEKLPILGKATYLTFKVRATQSNAGYMDFDLVSPDIINQIENNFVDRIVQHLKQDSQKLIKYLKLLWKT